MLETFKGDGMNEFKEEFLGIVKNALPFPRFLGVLLGSICVFLAYSVGAYSLLLALNWIIEGL